MPVAFSSYDITETAQHVRTHGGDVGYCRDRSGEGKDIDELYSVISNLSAGGVLLPV